MTGIHGQLLLIFAIFAIKRFCKIFARIYFRKWRLLTFFAEIYFAKKAKNCEINEN